ncbi:hypothetical protein CEK28_10610 [Xenophilus sp. AP218F]|nr:hypothetical protein CEK28_10610 [Xenophilus sp. AP218F]
MTKLHFWSDGDPTCGIARSETEIELELDGYNAEETADNIAHAKEVLSKALAEIWDNSTVHVMTSDELNRLITMQAAGVAQGIQNADEDLAMIVNQARKNFPPQVVAVKQELGALEAEYSRDKSIQPIGMYSPESTEAQWVRSMRDAGMGREEMIASVTGKLAKDSESAAALVDYYLGTIEFTELSKFVG